MKWLASFLLTLQAIGLYAAKPDPTAQYVASLKRVTDIMVSDVTSPVAAARYYAYTTLAAYEVLAGLRPEAYPPLSSALTHGTKLELPAAKEKDLLSCSVLAMWKTAYGLLPSGSRLKPAIDSLSAKLPASSLNLVDKTVSQVLAWVSKDGFQQLNNLKRYTPKRGPGYWQPTPPAFMAPVEPHWNTIRPFMLDSASQFLTRPPAAFDLNPGSPFYVLMEEVYQAVKEKDREKEAIANFWDCNPYTISQIGHVEFGLKKISPGGHWMGIAGVACKKSRFDLGKTMLTHTLVAITLHDAFIACWDEKYRSNRIRPETVINNHLDRSWKPVLQTPPFPEYVSGHSVASSASGIVLTAVFGEDYFFSDDVEVEYGLPVRKFRSFKQAAEEASISRLYGGIHFRDAIDQGIWQGKEIGTLISAKLKAFFDLLKKP